jgi:hypothetical protein
MMFRQVMLARIANDENHDRILRRASRRHEEPLRGSFLLSRRKKSLPFDPTMRDISNESLSVTLITSSTYLM